MGYTSCLFTESAGHSGRGFQKYAEAKRAIDKGNAQWIEAWEKSDPEMVAALFTDDGVMLSQGRKAFKGRQQILERQKAAMQSVTHPIKVSVITVKIWLDGDVAYEAGKYKYQYTEKGTPTTEEGRYVTMWKRQRDGSWKLSMDMAVPENDLSSIPLSKHRLTRTSDSSHVS